MNTARPDQQGKQLRAEIETVYSQLKSSKKLLGGHKGNDISDLVRTYLPVGTSFDDAENILRSAGFTVHPRPSPNVTDNRPDKYNVTAFLDSLDHGSARNVQVIVSLRPKAPGDYSAIHEISAGIFSTSL